MKISLILSLASTTVSLASNKFELRGVDTSCTKGNVPSIFWVSDLIASSVYCSYSSMRYANPSFAVSVSPKDAELKESDITFPAYNFINPKEFIHNQIIDVPLISSSYVTKPIKYNTHRNGYLVSGGDWYPHVEKYYNVALDVKNRIGGDWTFIVGDKTSSNLLNRLQKENVNIVPRPDTNGYRILLASHELSINQFGAMSFIDMNVTHTPTIMIPNELTSNDVYDNNGVIIDKEEHYRAKRYEEIGGGKVLLIDDVTIDSLTDTIYKVIKAN
mgnify:CR=1 FL=1